MSPSASRLLAPLIVLVVSSSWMTDGFSLAPSRPKTACRNSLERSSAFYSPRGFGISPPRLETTELNLLVDVPDNFFAVTFPILGIILSISKSFGRLRMEERAWEQRLEEAREKRLREDPTLTEIELRRREAALEWSAYGKPQEEQQTVERESRSGRRVKVMERDEEPSEGSESGKKNRMSDDEIGLFEMEYGVEYDPYYDDPYAEDELPNDIPFNVDRRYGDRIYENGEIFYKDKESGLYYRQGAKPRSLSFWN
jgi:hypothetical protein